MDCHNTKKYPIFIFLLTIIIFNKSLYAFEIYGHRGARGLAPENTLAGYEKALKLGVDYIDMDVALTKDGVLVTQHDLTLNPDLTRDKNGQWIKYKKAVNQLSFAELQTYHVGMIRPNTVYASLFPQQKSAQNAKIPSLSEAIDFILAKSKRQIKFQIEIKTDPLHPKISPQPKAMAQALAKLLQEKNIVNRTEVQAFDWRCLYEIKKINPQIRTAYLTDKESEKRMNHPNPHIAGLYTGGHLLKNHHHSIPNMIHDLGGNIWGPEDIQLNKQALIKAHQLGLKVVVWSNTESFKKDINLALSKKLLNMGIDGVITDRPDIIKQFT